MRFWGWMPRSCWKRYCLKIFYMDSDDFKEMREEQQKRRAERLPIRQREIELLASLGYKVEKKTEYQYRINGTFDLYPIHNRWHHLKTNKRGGAKNLAEFIKSVLVIN